MCNYLYFNCIRPTSQGVADHLTKLHSLDTYSFRCSSLYAYRYSYCTMVCEVCSEYSDASLFKQGKCAYALRTQIKFILNILSECVLFVCTVLMWCCIVCAYSPYVVQILLLLTTSHCHENTILEKLL